DVGWIAEANDQPTRLLFVVRLPEKESHLGGVSRFHLNRDLHGRARVEAGANLTGQSFVPHRGRIAQRVITPNEFGAISGERSRRWSRSGKGDAVAKFRVVGITGKQALALQIPFRNDMHTGFLWIGSENESGVGRDSQLSSARRIVAQAQTLQAHRLSPGIIDRHEGEQLLFDRMAVVFKHCVALTMSRTISILLPNRFGCRRPHDTDLIIANVDGGSGWIGDGIVEPRRETIVLAIAAPDTFRAGLGNQCAELRIRHDIDPRKWRVCAWTQINDEFLSVLGKAAKTVKVFQLHERQRRGRLFAELAPGYQLPRFRSRGSGRGKLLAQCAASCDQ